MRKCQATSTSGQKALEMARQYVSVVCVLCSLVSTPSDGSRTLDVRPSVTPPVITEGPDFHVYFKPNNDKISLPCSATGTQPIVYKWLRNGRSVEVSDRVIIAGGTLVIYNPTQDMEGCYQCLASNEAGVDMSNITFFQAAVLESSLPPRLLKSSVDRSVAEGDPLVLPCGYSITSIPPPQFRWESSTGGGHFHPVPLDSRIRQTSDGSLVFSFVRMNDTALYKCSLYNSVLLAFLGGSKFNLTIVANDASTIERRVNEPPVLLFSSADTKAFDGEDLTLTCLFGSWPPGYEVEWTSPSGSVSLNGTSITIRNMSARDEGIYNCRALKTMTSGDPLFSQTGSVVVQVDAIPSFTIFPTNQEIFVGQNATFACQGQGRPTPTVTWYANGTSVDVIRDTADHWTFFEGRTAYLILSHVHTTATITCNISNANGYRLHSAMIKFATENVVDTANSSSQRQGIDTWKTPTDLSSTLAKTSTQPYHQLSSHSNHAFNSETESSSKTQLQPTPNPQTSEAKFITSISIGVVVALLVVVIIISVIVFICFRQRKKRTADPVVPQDYRPRGDVLIVNNERIAYDSDDSGFDDLRTENAERRHLRQP